MRRLAAPRNLVRHIVWFAVVLDGHTIILHGFGRQQVKIRYGMGGELLGKACQKKSP